MSAPSCSDSFVIPLSFFSSFFTSTFDKLPFLCSILVLSLGDEVALFGNFGDPFMFFACLGLSSWILLLLDCEEVLETLCTELFVFGIDLWMS